MKKEDFFEIEDTEDFNLTEDFGQHAEESKDKTFNHTDILRIEETVFISWTGVTSCGKAERIRNEIREALKAWANRKMLDYQQYRYISYGNGTSKVHTYYRSRWGKRSCKSSTSIPFYIEFRKP